MFFDYTHTVNQYHRHMISKFNLNQKLGGTYNYERHQT